MRYRKIKVSDLTLRALVTDDAVLRTVSADGPLWVTKMEIEHSRPDCMLIVMVSSVGEKKLHTAMLQHSREIEIADFMPYMVKP